ncbi:transcriptional regulator [Dechloromonas sp. TW-R-39-2]|uniref:transcriptional regulator n=1 Tax=Dechloromonas sp. TW-R-39-2 TaxID=2654218 RepID=UPI00193CB951|nr:helix-turn-helix domain-containing protein [Dechloromonas sp. TW-R-39-2]QRM19545.1 transcriptional regulator [Dechloromonas sp. TW-R-39-2]
MNLTEYLSERGAVVRLASEIGVEPPLVSQWKNGHRPIPAAHCPAIERATSGVVSCESMRPDIDWAYIRSTAKVA